jgi:putative ABC transport system permease protein
VTEQTRFIAGDYFRTLGIPLRSGRLFDASDSADGPRVAIVSESFAKKYWQNQDPLGKRLMLFTQRNNNPWITVVGVVGDIRHLALHAELQPFIYYPLAQQSQNRMTLVVRSDSAPALLANAVREEVSNLDAEQAVFGIKTMEDYASDSIGQFKFTSLILTLIGMLALTLATVGIYGLMAFAISQRSHEIGVRLALGAKRSQIFGQVVGQGLVLAAVGVLLGVAGGSIVGWSMRNQLFGIEPVDPFTMAGSAVILFLIAVLACYFPARRAAQVDPSSALRFE